MEGSSSIRRAAATVCALFLCTASAATHADDHVVLLNWPDYIDPSLLVDFTAETGIEIEEVYYADDSDRDTMIALAEPGEFDIVIVSGDRLALLIDSGWLAPLGEMEAPTTANIDPEWHQDTPDALGFAVPMTWGTVGIAYRTDLIEQTITSWAQIFEPDEELCGQFWMLGDDQENIELALLRLGHFDSETTPEHLGEVRDLLLEQMPCVAAYRYPVLTSESKLVSGEIPVAVMYNSDAAMLSRFESRIEYVVPDNVTIRWTDFLTVPSDSERKPAAYAFIDFLNRPDNAARLADYLSFESPIASARSRQAEDVMRHPAIALNDGVRIFSERSFTADIVRRVNSLSAELQARRISR